MNELTYLPTETLTVGKYLSLYLFDKRSPGNFGVFPDPLSDSPTVGEYDYPHDNAQKLYVLDSGSENMSKGWFGQNKRHSEVKKRGRKTRKNTTMIKRGGKKAGKELGKEAKRRDYTVEYAGAKVEAKNPEKR